MHGIGADLMNQPCADRLDKPQLLRQWDELPGWQRPASWVIPTQQGLEATDPLALQAEYGLIRNGELGAFDRDAEIRLHLEPRTQPVLNFCRENPVSAAAFGLCLIQRHIGIPK